jgi:hypothetical protein
VPGSISPTAFSTATPTLSWTSTAQTVLDNQTLVLVSLTITNTLPAGQSRNVTIQINEGSGWHEYQCTPIGYGADWKINNSNQVDATTVELNVTCDASPQQVQVLQVPNLDPTQTYKLRLIPGHGYSVGANDLHTITANAHWTKPTTGSSGTAGYGNHSLTLNSDADDNYYSQQHRVDMRWNGSPALNGAGCNGSTFDHCWIRGGTGSYSFKIDGASSCTFTNCEFGNPDTDIGSAVLFIGYGATSGHRFTNCYFHGSQGDILKLFNTTGCIFDNCVFKIWGTGADSHGDCFQIDDNGPKGTRFIHCSIEGTVTNSSCQQCETDSTWDDTMYDRCWITGGVKTFHYSSIPGTHPSSMTRNCQIGDRLGIDYQSSLIQFDNDGPLLNFKARGCKAMSDGDPLLNVTSDGTSPFNTLSSF